MRTIGRHGGDLQIIGQQSNSTRDSMRNPPGGRTSLSKRSKPVLPATGPPRGRHAGRGQLPHNPLMAGRRRRTAAAALLWRHFRCRYHSSNHSTDRGRRLRWKKKIGLKKRVVDEPNNRTTRRALSQSCVGPPCPKGSAIGRRARAVGVRVELDLRGLVAVVVGSAQSSARPCEHVHHRCARDDASTLLRACHGCLKRSSGGEQGEAQRGLHGL